MATLINMTTKRPNSKTVTKSIISVNPNASNAQIKEFADTFNDLSENELLDIEKVEKTNIDLD